MQTFWHDLLVPGISAGEKIFRTVGVYAFLLVGLKVAGKRELGQLNTFDLVVLLLLSNAVQNAIIGDDNSLLGGVLGAITLLVVNHLVVRFLYDHPRLEAAVEGTSEVLVLNGDLQEEAMRKNLVTMEELEAAARGDGIDDLRAVHCARLEVGGDITFVLKEPTPEEARHDELIARLAKLEDQLGRLLAREASARG